MTIYGYARVSTVDQNLDQQKAALRAAGVEPHRIHTDYASGAKDARPGLGKLMAELEEGDTLMVWKLDRLGRSMSHLVRVLDDLRGRGAEFASLTESLDTRTPAGRLQYGLLACLAEYERAIGRERTMLALEHARRSKKQLGRPSRVNEHQYRAIFQMNEQGKTQYEIAQTTSLSRAVVGRVLRGEIASLRVKFGDLDDDDSLPLFGPQESTPDT